MFMKFLIKIIFIFLFILPFVSKGQGVVLINNVIASELECGSLTIIENFNDEIFLDNFDIQNVTITEDCINISLRYSGGCGYVNCQLITNNFIIETNPPKVYLEFKFEDYDYCKAIRHKNVSFDISSFKEYAQSTGIIIMLKNTEYRLIYKLD